MLTKEEESFFIYWEENRLREKKIHRQLFPGLPIGLSIGVAIFLLLDSGWYERANMVANTQTNPLVLIIAILAIIIFTGIFYKKHRWEMNEQYYTELKFKKEKELLENNAAKQTL